MMLVRKDLDGEEVPKVENIVVGGLTRLQQVIRRQARRVDWRWLAECRWYCVCPAMTVSSSS